MRLRWVSAGLMGFLLVANASTSSFAQTSSQLRELVPGCTPWLDSHQDDQSWQWLPLTCQIVDQQEPVPVDWPNDRTDGIVALHEPGVTRFGGPHPNTITSESVRDQKRGSIRSYVLRLITRVMRGN